MEDTVSPASHTPARALAGAGNQAGTLDLRANGVRYTVQVAGSGPPLVLLHGFTGSSTTWQQLNDLTRHFRTIAVDLLGHGETDAPADPARYRMERAVADIQVLLDTLLHTLEDGTRERFGLLGYSMGGRLALHVALAMPERVAALVLESASPGILDAQERANRVRGDEELAQFAERKGVAAFSRRWEALPLFASQARLPMPVRMQLRAERMRNNPRGLANSLRGMGAGAQAPLHDVLSTLPMPVLLIAGALDKRYRELAETMSAEIPNAQAVIVPDAGHTVHLEQPQAFTDEVLRFFRGLQEGDTADAEREGQQE